MGTQAIQRKELGPDERRERRRLRREKQRIENVGRAVKMHTARLASTTAEPGDTVSCLEASAYVGCSGWFYWKWRGQFYPTDLPTGEWFNHYATLFDTVEINASFYSWPTVANVKGWVRQPGSRSFIYTVKVCELITHIKRFKGTKTLVMDFGMIADILGERMGCFLFQLPPSYHFTKARLNGILGQLDRPGAMWWSFVTPVGGTKLFTRPFVRQVQSFAHAAALAFRMSWCGRPMMSTCDFMVPSAGIGMTTQETS